MFTKLISVDTSDFPKSWLLLQQEAILANSCIRTGFEFMVKGGFDDVYKGHYYSSFFQLSIGIERIMKLVIISHYMVNNNYKAPDNKSIRDYGHDLVKLYENISKIADNYNLAIPNSSVTIPNDMLAFLNYFAKSTVHYHNISNLDVLSVNNIDPLVKWREIIERIESEDFTEPMRHRLENEVFNRINLALQLDDIAFNTGYVDGVYDIASISKANFYAVWHILYLIKPLLEILFSISKKSHNQDTISTIEGNNFPHIPYFNEIFLLFYTSKRDCLKKKRWTD